jgi:DNA-binding CsgD family transcriptional regulator
MKRWLTIIYMIVCYCTIACGAKLVSHWPSVGKSADSIIAVMEQSRGYQSIRQKHNVQILYKLSAKHHDMPVLRWRALFWDAYCRKMSGKEVEARNLIGLADRLVDKKNFEYDYQRIHGLKAAYDCLAVGNYYQCYLVYTKSLAYFQSIDDLIMQAYYFNAIGALFNNLGELSLALDYFKNAKKLYFEGGSFNESLKEDLNIAICYAALGNSKESNAILKFVESKKEAQSDTAFYIKVLMSMAAGTPTRAGAEQEKYVMRMYDLARQWHDSTLLVRSRINLGAFYIEKKEFVKALAYYKQSLPYVEHIHNVFSEIACLDGIGICYRQLNQNDSAAKYLERYIMCKDSLTQANHVNDIKNMESLAKIKAYNKDIQIEKGKARSRLLIILLVSTVLLLLLGGVCYMLWSMSQKERMKKQLKEAENAALSKNLEVEQLQNRQHKLEIEAQNRQLMLDALRLNEKENALKAVQKQIMDASESGKEAKIVAHEVENQIKMHVDVQTEWESFRHTFEKVHPGFFRLLKRKYSSLSENEMRLCAFINAGMTNKQIAYMLNIQPNSLKKARYRIRQKLNLSTEDSLEDFLRTIAE